MTDISMVQSFNPFIAFGLCMILTIFMATWEWIESKNKQRVKLCIQTAIAGSIFIVSLVQLMFLLFPSLSSMSKN